MYGLASSDDTEYIPLNEWDYKEKTQDKLLLVEVGDILVQLEQAIHWRGEQPVHGNVWSENMDAFINEIYDQIAYLPNGQRQIKRNVDGALDACGLFFDQHAFTHFQREQWHLVAQRLIDRFMEYRLYNERFEHRYDFYALRGDTLILKLFE